MDSNEEMYISWINSVLEAAQKNPTSVVTNLIESCGMKCAKLNGHLEGATKLREMADNCHSRTDYVAFFSNVLHIRATEAEDGIILYLGKPHCTCPMASHVSGSSLCNCTKGHEKAVWSKFFGKSIDVEIMESWQRGGSDCVIKLFV